MTDHDLQIQTDDGSTVVVTVTPLDGGNADQLADDVAAILTQEYGENVRET
jgi:hypothetical protein